MIKKAITLLFLFICFFANAQSPQVPTEMEFAGIKLRLNRNAQRLVQANVDALTKNLKYFQVKIERANIYFPLIDRIFEEQGVPGDFKYLVMQESALISDAVSTSNAVGYWQFKKETAIGVGMQVDGDVDERMHIAASTRGAAKYLKKNNIYLNNWLNSLLSYNLGLGGVKLLVRSGDSGTEAMEIEGTTHVYILKFLSHKIAFENALRQTPGKHTLLEYADCQNKTLKSIADHLELNEEELNHYNRWLKTRKIPNDKPHSVIIPATEINYKKLAAIVGAPTEINTFAKNDQKKTSPNPDKVRAKLTTFNKLKAVIAGDGDNFISLVHLGKISRGRFQRYNDLQLEEFIVPGQVYFLEAKKLRADEEYHTVEEGETYWSISQKYALKKSKLFKYNRINKDEKLQTGRVLWLSSVRPSMVPVEIKIPIRAKERPQEVKVITYPDRRQPETKSSAITKNEESAEMFPEDFYEDDKKGISKTTRTEIKLSDREDSHQVKQGETLYSISRDTGVSMEDLKSWNNINEGENIKTGQALTIKKSKSSELTPASEKSPTYITHIVAPGESFYKIAKQYNVTISQLLNWNNKRNNSIAIGEELKIHKIALKK